jgi:hypothetical protein
MNDKFLIIAFGNAARGGRIEFRIPVEHQPRLAEVLSDTLHALLERHEIKFERVQTEGDPKYAHFIYIEWPGPPFPLGGDK